MAKPKLILIGAGGHARACLDVIEQGNRFEVVGLIGVAEEVGARHLGYDVLGTDAELQDMVRKYPNALVSVGQIKSAERRIQLFRKALDYGFNLPAIISPLAMVSRHAVVGAGTIVMHGVVVNAGATVGSNCILNTNSVIEHDVSVGDSTHISTGAIINGGTSVGAGSFVGSGSVVREGLELGAACVIGMGSRVRHSLEEGEIFLGGDND